MGEKQLQHQDRKSERKLYVCVGGWGYICFWVFKMHVGDYVCVTFYVVL